MHISAKVAI